MKWNWTRLENVHVILSLLLTVFLICIMSSKDKFTRREGYWINNIIFRLFVKGGWPIGFLPVFWDIYVFRWPAHMQQRCYADIWIFLK